MHKTFVEIKNIGQVINRRNYFIFKYKLHLKIKTCAHLTFLQSIFLYSCQFQSYYNHPKIVLEM